MTIDVTNVSRIEKRVQVQLVEALSDLGHDGYGGGDVDYVTISIGGNDIGFSGIVSEVAYRGFGVVDRDYLVNSLNKAWVSYDGVPRHLAARTDFAFEGERKSILISQCYERICDAFPNAEIIVVGYPTLMNDDKWQLYESSTGFFNRLIRRFDWGMSEYVGFADWEAATVNADARLFNDCLEAQVAECNKELRDGGEDHDRLHFVSVLEGETTFDGHEAYTDEPFLNPVWPTQSEDLTSLPIPVSSYSFHPNYKGEAGGTDASEKPHDGISCYRIAVQRMLDKLEDERPLVAYLDGEPDEDEAYAAYASKLEEYVGKYGGPRVVSGGSTWSVSGDGVCLAELVDFDGDGLEELYLAYYDPDNESDEYDWSNSGHDANAYVIEAWSFVDGGLCMAYQGQASSSQQGLAYCTRAILDNTGGDSDGRAVSWIHYSGYAGGDYSSSLWSIDGGSASMEHEWRIVGEFTPDMRWLADDKETDLDEGEWLDAFAAEWRSYALMDFAQDEHVSECVDLTKETMHRLGVTAPASEQLGDASTQIQAIEDLAGSSLVWVHTTDFDGDGAEETFGITGESYGSNYREGKAWRSTRLWYASSSGETQSVASFDRIVYVNDVFDDPAGSGYQLLSLELTAGGSGASSKVYGVQRDIPREIQVSGREVQAQDGRIILAKDFFGDAGGHMLEWYELTFDQSSFALAEGPSLGVTELFDLPGA